MSDVSDMFKVPECGPRRCERCDTMIDAPPGSICDACYEAERDKKWSRLVIEKHMFVRETIPAKRRWAVHTAPELRERVSDPGAIVLAIGAIERGRSAVLIGPSGVGKTSLAIAMLDYHLAIAAKTRDEARLVRSCTSRFLRATKLQADWWNHSRGVDECNTVAEALRADLLVLDDLGIEPRSPIVIRVIKDRAEEGRQTIVTTSRRPTQGESSIESVYGEGVWRAITDDAAYLELHERSAR